MRLSLLVCNGYETINGMLSLYGLGWEWFTTIDGNLNAMIVLWFELK